MTTVLETSPTLQSSASQSRAHKSNPSQSGRWPDRILASSGVLWFLAAAAGQWIFVYYVAAYYIPVLALKGLPGLGDTTLPEGYVAGDPIEISPSPFTFWWRSSSLAAGRFN